MKKFILFLVFIIFSCQKKITEKDLHFLNGYWQISKVEMANGEKKEYKVNETYDYFEVKNKTGFRKKVKWQLNGKFLVDNLSEQIKIVVVEDDLIIEYKSKFNSNLITEKIIELTQNELILKSNNDSKYFYSKVKI